jgi:hypothetical protein
MLTISAVPPGQMCRCPRPDYCCCQNPAISRQPCWRRGRPTHFNGTADGGDDRARRHRAREYDRRCDCARIPRIPGALTGQDTADSAAVGCSPSNSCRGGQRGSVPAAKRSHWPHPLSPGVSQSPPGHRHTSVFGSLQWTWQACGMESQPPRTPSCLPRDTGRNESVIRSSPPVGRDRGCSRCPASRRWS